MLRRVETDLLVTEKAKARIRIRLAEPSTYSRIAALLLAQNTGTKQTSWEVAYYDRRVVEEADFDGFLIQTPDIEFVLPQSNLLEHVSGMQLDWDGSRFVLKKQSGAAHE